MASAPKRRVPDSLRLGDGDGDEMDEKRSRIDDAKDEKSPQEMETKNPPEDDKRLKTTLDLDTFKCSICLNLWHDVVCVSPCQHNFCNACFSEWYKTSQQNGQGECKCPQCRGDIVYACKNHAMASLVEDLLTNNPSLKRPQNDIEKMDKAALVTSSFMKVNNPRPITMSSFRANLGRSRRPRPSLAELYEGFVEEGSEEESESEEEAESDPESEGGVPGPEVSCRQCRANSSSFRCQPGSSHLVCHTCACRMPERTDLTVPQKCAACRAICCDAYWRFQNLVSDSGEHGCPTDRLLNMTERQVSSIPHGAHKSNTVEQEFTKQYLSEHRLTLQDVVRDWMAKVDRAELALPDMQAITSTSPICNYCADKVTSHLLDKFRMSIPKAEMPPDAARRDDCWYGLSCRTQVHNVAHAKKLNHVCEPTARNAAS